MTRRRKKRSSEHRGPRQGTRRESRRAGASLHPDQQRQVIAQQAARIVVEQGIADYGTAKRKAAERLGTVAPSLLPSNAMVEHAVVEHQRLFGGARHSRRLRELREGACEAMRFFEEFEPRLVGAVLSGAASEHSPVTLHLFVDDPAAVVRRLVDHGIPFREVDRRLRYAPDRVVTCPACCFSVEGVDYEALMLSRDAIRQPPVSPVDGRAMRRASLGDVEALLREQDEGDVLPWPASPAGERD